MEPNIALSLSLSGLYFNTLHTKTNSKLSSVPLVHQQSICIAPPLLSKHTELYVDGNVC